MVSMEPDGINGLSEAEAARRLEAEGYNELPTSGKRNILVIAFEVAREPMFLLLIAAGVVYLLLGDFREALMLLFFVLVVMFITFIQERKTERALEALRDLSSPRALVIRDGMTRRIAGREVVRGDTLVLSEGDRVPADAMLISCSYLSIDESLLTGESVPVRKVPCNDLSAMGRPGGDDLPFVFSGTMVVKGSGFAEVKAVGSATEIGKIGRALHHLEPEETFLRRETGKVVRALALSGLLLCIFVIVVYGVTRGNWLNGLLAGITLAMAMIPEEFPVILTIFLALGAWRMSHHRVLTRRIPAIETLGSATVLCVDKTGTLTMNRMRVAKVFSGGRCFNIEGPRHAKLPEEIHEVVEFAVLASQREPFDPMEKALRELGVGALSGTEHLHDDWVMMQEYPLSQEMLAMSRVWRSRDGTEIVIAAKGAPEAIADLCHFAEAEMNTLTGRINSMAAEGLRIIGVAKAGFRHDRLPHEQHDFPFEFLGLVGFADPVREGVADAVRECDSAGIRVVMITGDYAGTATSVAKQIGLPSGEVITGLELDELSDAELRDRTRTVNIFARVVPEQKLRIVNALKANGEVVAMTGDGVNDAPALKAAHIGVAMGGRGTDVAREASALVVTDDDFSAIVQAVRTGRRIYDNLKKAMAYVFAIHVPIAGMSLIPVVLEWPLVLLPVHILFLELIIDPACSVVFEAEREEEDVMLRPPRDPRAPLFDRRMVGLSLLQGSSVLLIVLAVFSVVYYRGQGESEARALSFTTLIVANLSLILTNRSWTRIIPAMFRLQNSALWWVLGGTVVFLGLVLFVPFLRGVFHFTKLHPDDLVLCVVAGLASIMWFELLKVLNARRRPVKRNKPY